MRDAMGRLLRSHLVRHVHVPVSKFMELAFPWRQEKRREQKGEERQDV
jgi:hypothetical protein